MNLKEHLKDKSIRVGHVDVLIKYVEGKIENDLEYGTYEASSNDVSINIDSSLENVDLFTNVFYHELVHAMLHQMGADETNNELFVQSLANMLQQVIPQITK